MAIRCSRCFDEYLRRRPERLVIHGFRCCMAGYDLADADCWDLAWQVHAEELGSEQTRPLMGALQAWIRSLRAAAARPIEYYPPNCRFLCYHECMALSAVAAGQAGDRATGELALANLDPAGDRHAVTALWPATCQYAQVLLDSGNSLYPVPEGVVRSITALHRARQRGPATMN